jgi:hypothetical protein
MHYVSCFGGPGVVSEKRGRTRYTVVVFLHPVRPWHETSTYYFSCLGGPGAVSIKSTLGHVTSNLWLLHLVGSTGHVVHSGASGA